MFAGAAGRGYGGRRTFQLPTAKRVDQSGRRWELLPYVRSGAGEAPPHERFARKHRKPWFCPDGRTPRSQHSQQRAAGRTNNTAAGGSARTNVCAPKCICTGFIKKTNVHSTRRQVEASRGEVAGVVADLPRRPHGHRRPHDQSICISVDDARDIYAR